MSTIPLILNLGKNLTEYAEQTAQHGSLTDLVNSEYPAHQLQGHKPECQADPTTRLGYHGSYLRRRIIDTEGQRQSARIHRVYCLNCLKTWTIYPAILIPGKHFDSYVVQNTLEANLSLEQTYRAVTRQQAQLTSSGAARPQQFVNPRTPWNWVIWLGRFSLPLVLLACGLTPPAYGVEDEKFLKQEGERSYTLGLVDQRFDLVWWLDYIFATDQTALQNSLGKLLALFQQAEPGYYFKGMTTDGWQAAKNAFAELDERTALAECALHPLLKFKQVVAQVSKQQNWSATEVDLLLRAFSLVVFAPTAESFEQNLTYLASWPQFQVTALAERLASLRRKQTGLCLRYSDPNLAATSSALDRVFKRLERKFSSMQQFRTEESGLATLSAWGLVYNFRRFGPGSKRAGHSPVELAGLDLEGLPWLQFILIKWSKLQVLKPEFAHLPQSL
jgi:hypothetical protein